MNSSRNFTLVKIFNSKFPKEKPHPPPLLLGALLKDSYINDLFTLLRRSLVHTLICGCISFLVEQANEQSRQIGSEGQRSPWPK